MTTPPTFSPQQVTAAIVAGLRRPNQAGDLSREAAAQQAGLYRSNLVHYRQHVQKSLSERDYLPAAEKSWGAYAQIIKSIGAERQFTVPHHGAIVGVAARLALLVSASNPAAGDALLQGLNSARSLHQHFYENDLPDETVIANADGVAEVIDLLQQLFPPEPTDQ